VGTFPTFKHNPEFSSGPAIYEPTSLEGRVLKGQDQMPKAKVQAESKSIPSFFVSALLPSLNYEDAELSSFVAGAV